MACRLNPQIPSPHSFTRLLQYHLPYRRRLVSPIKARGPRINSTIQAAVETERAASKSGPWAYSSTERSWASTLCAVLNAATS